MKITTVFKTNTVLSSCGQESNNNLHSPLELHMCQEQWSCRECLGCHSMVDLCECPEWIEKKYVAILWMHFKIFPLKHLKQMNTDFVPPQNTGFNSWFWLKTLFYIASFATSRGSCSLWRFQPETWCCTSPETYSTQWQRERLQNIQHSLQHTTAPKQMRESG